MYPLVPARALGGGVAAPRLHAGQKDPWACRERSLTHIVSPSGLVSSCFPGFRLQKLALSKPLCIYANGQML